MDFFNDLITLTPIQHLIEHWVIWCGWAVFLFSILIILNRKSPRKAQ